MQEMVSQSPKFSLALSIGDAQLVPRMQVMDSKISISLHPRVVVGRSVGFQDSVSNQLKVSPMLAHPPSQYSKPCP